MRILIEEYQYDYKDICELTPGLETQHDSNMKVTLERVGYFYSSEVQDCIFVLPKVLLKGKRGEEKVFGDIDPRDLILFDKCKELQKDERKKERDFIYNLSIWIYRAICVFKEHEFDRREKNEKYPSIVLERNAPMLKHGNQQKHHTLLDILLALQKWNKDNQHYVTFIVKNLHAGYNKINWTKTINCSKSIIQEENRLQSVVYLNPVNKQRKINFDEELLVIYYSILNYIHEEYGLPVIINVNFPLIKGTKFKKYRDGYGTRRLRQIKYKYFSDKALELWNLCYDFFSHPTQVSLFADKNEYLMVKSFHVVFEAIIDELIAGDQHLPNELLDQEDGKRVDHMFLYRELVNNNSGKNIYYIGDSKYYKIDNSLDSKSVYKQYTYARNVIQWNIDLFNDGSKKKQQGHVKLRDDVTEGYNPIPNFFISAHQMDLEKKDDIHLTTSREAFHLNRQFENRLFDRDTFILAHYDVNFLFVLALYGQNKETAKTAWREKARELFRKEIQNMLEYYFIFYAMTAHEDVEPNTFIKENFQTLLGKVFQPFENQGSQQYFSLALRNPEKIELKDKQKEQELKAEVRNENDQVMFQLKQAFYVKPCALGVDPKGLLPIVQPRPHRDIPQKLLTFHYLENYPETSFLVGGFREDQKEWMFGRKGGKVDDAYNIRMGIDIEGGIKRTDTLKQAKFVLLYEYEKEHEGVYKAFRVKGYQEKTKEDLIKEGYPSPHHDRYYCYIFDEEVNLGTFDEEVNLGTFDIGRLISKDCINYASEIHQSRSITKKYPEGRPIFIKGSELLKFWKECSHARP